MRDLRTYINESFKLGKNKVKTEEDDFVDLGLPSGTLWCKHNVGATCGSDAKSWYGDYFMWGDIEPATNKRCNWTNYKYAVNNYNELNKYCPDDKTDYWDGKGNPDNKLTLDIEDDIARANIGRYCNMPTKDDIQELIDNTTNKWVKDYNNIQGLNGILFTSNKNSNTLFIPAAGHRIGDSIDSIGFEIGVWSSILCADDPEFAFIYCSTYFTRTKFGKRNFGYSVRAVIN